MLTCNAIKCVICHIVSYYNRIYFCFSMDGGELFDRIRDQNQKGFTERGKRDKRGIVVTRRGNKLEG